MNLALFYILDQVENLGGLQLWELQTLGKDKIARSGPELLILKPSQSHKIGKVCRWSYSFPRYRAPAEPNVCSISMNKHKLLRRSKTRAAKKSMHPAAVQLRYKLTHKCWRDPHPLGSEPMPRIFIRTYLYWIPQIFRLILCKFNFPGGQFILKYWQPKEQRYFGRCCM